MTYINVLRNIAGTRDSVAWGKLNTQTIATNIQGNIHALVFSAVLIVCSLAVGCSSSKDNDQPKLASSNNQIPAPSTQSSMAPMPAPVALSDSKPAAKKVVHRKPATVNYTDKTYGVTFEYPRRYAIETGDAAAELLVSNPVPMNFVQPGGVALAAVELPETGFANTDFSSAFFNVSVHKNLTADQCNEFAVPQSAVQQTDVTQTGGSQANGAAMPAPATIATNAEQTVTSNKPEAATPAASTGSSPGEVQSSQTASTSAEPAKTASSDVQAASAQATQSAAASSEPATEQPGAAKVSTETTQSASSATESQGSKLLLGDMELRATEAVSGEGTRQSDSKYFHIFRNGACYEFGLNVTTVASQDGLMKHIDRDKVFSRLEKILDTAKINPVTPEVSAETPATTAAPASPAQ